MGMRVWRMSSASSQDLSPSEIGLGVRSRSRLG